MPPEHERQPAPRQVRDPVELEDFIEQRQEVHHDLYGEHSHQLTEEGAEASSRLLIRVVPLAYGGLLGGLSEYLALGMAVGASVSIGFDLNMAQHSLVRRAGRRLSIHLCPTMASAVHALAAILRRLRIPASARLSGIRCSSSRS